MAVTISSQVLGFGTSDLLMNSFSLVNSTSTPLGISGVFTGTAEDISKYSDIRVSVFSDVASATDGLLIEQSKDGINWDASDAYTIPANTNKVFGVGAAANFFRVIYTNGGTAQATFRLSVKYNITLTKPSSVRMSDSRSNDNDFEEVASYNALFNGASWDRARTPNKFITLNAVSIASETTIWTPAAGKKFRLMGYVLETGTVGGNVQLKDNTAGTLIHIVPFGAASTVIVSPFMGNGQLSSAANNVLTATGAATQTLSGTLIGIEE